MNEVSKDGKAHEGTEWDWTKPAGRHSVTPYAFLLSTHHYFENSASQLLDASVPHYLSALRATHARCPIALPARFACALYGAVGRFRYPAPLAREFPEIVNRK